jgi:hypothetical protein
MKCAFREAGESIMLSPFVTPRTGRLPLGETLLREGAVDQAQLDAALAEQQAWGGKLGRTLVELGFVEERRMAGALARHLGIEEAALDETSPEPRALRTLTADVCRLFCVLPLEIDERRGTLRLATFDPDADTISELQRVTGMKVLPVIAPSADIERAIQRHYFGRDAAVEPAPEARSAFPAPAAVEAAPGVAELQARLDALEKLVALQARALRELVKALARQGSIASGDLD